MNTDCRLLLMAIGARFADTDVSQLENMCDIQCVLWFANAISSSVNSENWFGKKAIYPV